MYDGNTWTTGNLSFTNHLNSCTVYNDKIYLVTRFNVEYTNGTSTYYIYFYTFDGSTLQNIYTYSSSNVSIFELIVYNNKIYAVDKNSATLYIFNGNSLTKVGQAYSSTNYTSTVCDGKIYMIGANYGSINKICTAYDGNKFTQYANAPYRLDDSRGIAYNGYIYIFSGFWNKDNYIRYNPSTNSWTDLGTMPCGSLSCTNVYNIFIYNDSIYLGYFSNAVYTSPEKIFDPYTIILQRGETGSGKYLTAFSDLKKNVTSNNSKNRFVSGFDDAWYFGDSSFEHSPIYYGDGTQWIQFKY